MSVYSYSYSACLDYGGVLILTVSSRGAQWQHPRLPHLRLGNQEREREHQFISHTACLDYGESAPHTLPFLPALIHRGESPGVSPMRRWATKSKNKEIKTTLYHSRLGLPRVSRRPGCQLSYRPFRPRSLPFSPPWLCLRVPYAPRWSSPFPYPLSSAFRCSPVETRTLVFMLEPSLRSGDPVAYLECINVGGGDSILTAFGVLEVSGGEASPPLTLSLLRLGPCLGAGGGGADGVARGVACAAGVAISASTSISDGRAGGGRAAMARRGRPIMAARSSIFFVFAAFASRRLATSACSSSLSFLRSAMAPKSLPPLLRSLRRFLPSPGGWRDMHMQL